MQTNQHVTFAILLTSTLLVPARAGAQQEEATATAVEQSPVSQNPQEQPATPRAPDEARQREIERRIQVLADEVERLRLGDVVPRAEGSVYGLGPAASKVYRQQHGVSLGGYGELLYQNFLKDDTVDRIDFQRAILYAGYKFSDRVVLNTEIEIEHAREAWVEFAYLDFLLHPAFNVRAGLVLLPMGLLNELHEPTVFLGAMRPDTEQRILPTTWRENGVGVFGDVGPLSYRAYLVNGAKGAGFTSKGLRGGRQKGAEAMANDFAGVARVDLTAVPGVLVGGSVYYGESDQDLKFSLPTFIYELHADVKWRGLEARALFAAAHLDDNVATLNDTLKLTGTNSIGTRMRGFYAQLGYDVLSILPGARQSLVPFVRWEELDTQASVPATFAAADANDLSILTVGGNWYPIDQVVVKLEYQNRTDAAEVSVKQVNALVGYIF